MMILSKQSDNGSLSEHHHRRRRRQRSAILSRRPPHIRRQLLATLLSACILESTHAQTRQLQHHEYLFPENDEYDPFILDATHMYGSPMGGFSRATKSRLASRPLKLPFRPAQEDNEEDSAVASEAHFWEIADGIGRRYVCRIFDEDEVELTSLSQDSLFDPPVFRLAVEVEDYRHNDLGR